MSEKSAAVLRGGEKLAFAPGTGLIRPAHALWSLYLKDLRSGDRVVIGDGEAASRPILCLPPAAEGTAASKPAGLDTASGFEIVPIVPDGAPSRSWAQLDSFAGLPLGPRWIHGIPFAPAIRDGKWAVTKRCSFEKPVAGVDHIYLIYAAGDGPPPALLSDKEAGGGLRPDLEAIAWHAWPPIYTARLLVGRYPVEEGKAATGVDPKDRIVLAATAFRAGDARREETQRRVAARLRVAASEWEPIRRAEERAGALRAEMASVPRGAIALLPPGSAARGLLGRAGLHERAVMVSPRELVEPASFNAQRFPAALYTDGEDYVHTVRSPGDGATALVRYLEEGGALVLMASGPWPLFYATGPGLRRAEPLTDRLGLPLLMAAEQPPDEELTVRIEEQAIVKTSRPEFPYPEGDPRLRAIDRRRIPAGATYTPIAKVVGRSGKGYGDAAGLVDLSAKGTKSGRILYISYSLLRDPTEGPAFLEGALRFLAREAKGGGK
jgi:hypothetical protein